MPKGNDHSSITQTQVKKTLVVVGGPTASGKTSLAIALAQRLGTEIISADSRQFFKELTIGTAKPSAEELFKVTHHFINSHTITEEVNAADYGIQASAVIHQLFETKDTVVMVGGSGLFIDAVIKGFDDLPPSDEPLRLELQSQLNDWGIESLQDRLKELDPEAYSKIDIKNSRRLIRALEVTILSGKPYSAQLNQKRTPSHGWHVVMIGIEHDRTALYQRIDERTRQMIADGLKEEVISVIEHRQRQALQTVGYTEMFQHLDGALTLEETEKLIAQHTRNYAKRQMTWFNRYENLIWIAPTDSNQMADAVMKHLHQ